MDIIICHICQLGFHPIQFNNLISLCRKEDNTSITYICRFCARDESDEKKETPPSPTSPPANAPIPQCGFCQQTKGFREYNGLTFCSFCYKIIPAKHSNKWRRL